MKKLAVNEEVISRSTLKNDDMINHFMIEEESFEIRRVQWMVSRQPVGELETESGRQLCHLLK